MGLDWMVLNVTVVNNSWTTCGHPASTRHIPGGTDILRGVDLVIDFRTTDRRKVKFDGQMGYTESVGKWQSSDIWWGVSIFKLQISGIYILLMPLEIHNFCRKTDRLKNSIWRVITRTCLEDIILIASLDHDVSPVPVSQETALEHYKSDETGFLWVCVSGNQRFLFLTYLLENFFSPPRLMLLFIFSWCVS